MEYVFVIALKFNIMGFQGDGFPPAPAHRGAFHSFADCSKLIPKVRATLAGLPAQVQPIDIVCQKTPVR